MNIVERRIGEYVTLAVIKERLRSEGKEVRAEVAGLLRNPPQKTNTKTFSGSLIVGSVSILSSPSRFEIKFGPPKWASEIANHIGMQLYSFSGTWESRSKSELERRAHIS